MAYTKNTWKTGDIVSSQKLNHMEDGIANADRLVITAATSGTTKTLDKTWQEIYDAMAQGKLCVVKIDNGDLESGIEAYIVTLVYHSGEEYNVGMGEGGVYTASSATGYPEYSSGPINPSGPIISG